MKAPIESKDLPTLAHIFSEAYQPQNEPRDKSSWLANHGLKVAGALPRHSIIVTVAVQSTFGLYASLLLGGALIILMFWWHVKLARSRIKRFWIGTKTMMSSCIHLYWWYLLKARVNLIWDTQCAWLCRACCLSIGIKLALMAQVIF